MSALPCPASFGRARGPAAWLALTFGASAALAGCAPAAATSPALRAAPPAVAAAPSAPPKQGVLPFRLPCADDDFEGCQKGCDDKVVEDCVTLAAMFMPSGRAVDKATGAPVAPNPPRALELYRNACEIGSARGCMRLADAHHEGMLDDKAEETRLYRRACESGANGGCVAAGRAFLDGRGVDADAVQAADLFGRVCLRGNAPACFELARLYESGEGVKADKDRAFQLFTKACKLGHDQGCLYAGRTEEVLPPRN